MRISKTHSAFGEELIIEFDISSRDFDAQIVYAEYINSLIEFSIRHIRPAEIYKNKKFMEFISLIGIHSNIGVTLTLIQLNQTQQDF